jgi:hypothetical protein
VKQPSFKGLTVAELAGAVCSHLESEGIDAVLVGGSVVTVYTDNRFVSNDLDIVTSAGGQRLAEAMKKIGFSTTDKRYMTHPDAAWLIEFLNAPVAVGGKTSIRPREMKTALGSFKVLSPLDIIKDRLIWRQHYNDAQALEQAVMVCRSQKLDLTGLAAWAKREGTQDSVQELMRRVSDEKD